MATFVLARLLLLAATPCTGDVAVERSAYLMGTLLRVEARGSDRGCTVAATEAALDEIARLESVLSSWRPDSEVGRLNRAVPGVRVALSPELTGLLAEATSWHERTDGAFDPAVGALIEAWDLRGAGRLPSPSELESARRSSGLARLTLSAGVAARPDTAWWLDTGAFGKGAALRSAAAVLRAHGVADAVLDFGGQLLVLGGPHEVAVADPRARSEAMPQRLRLTGASISTTSSSERHVAVAGARYGHVLDPRNGRPVAAWGSVSVVAADALVADALSTALFVLGPAAALEWAALHPEVGVLVQQVAGDDVVVTASRGLEPYLIHQLDNDSGASLR